MVRLSRRRSAGSGAGGVGDSPWKDIPVRAQRSPLSAYGKAAGQRPGPASAPSSRGPSPHGRPGLSRPSPEPAAPWKPSGAAWRDRPAGRRRAEPFPAPASPAASPGRYRPGLDGLRALAVTAVLLYHADIHWMRGGFLGVDLFFVLSGFLITSLLIVELEGSGRIGFASFYRRRARRLLPALGAVLAVTTAALLLFWPQELHKVRADLVASLGYVANWWFIIKHQSYFQATGRPSAFQHLWSLAVEEQFYLLWPLAVSLLLAGAATVRRLKHLGAAALIGAVASTAWMALIAAHERLPYGADASRVYFGTDTHAMGVLLGAAAAALVAVAERSDWGRRLGRRSLPVLEAAGAAGLLVACWAMMHASKFTPGLYRGGFLAFAAVAAIAVMAVSRSESRLGEALGWAPLRWIGTRSYALYLWHWPVYVFTRPQLDVPFGGGANLILRLTLTAAAAEASYRLVEQPIRTEGVRAWLDRLARALVIPLRQSNALGGRLRARWQTATALGMTVALAVLGTAGFIVAPRHAGRSTAAGRAANARTHPGMAHPVSMSVTPGRPAPGQAAPPAPAAAPAPAAPAARSLTAIGDSVMLGATAEMQRALPGVVVDAVEGRQATEAFATIEHLLATGHLGREVVLQTGTNGTIDPVALGALLSRLSDRRVVIVNVHVPRPWQDSDNAILAAVARSSGRVELVDWNAAASSHPQWLWGDGIHLRSTGAQQYADLVLRALG